jgi:collagenase-like PrtC family protease
MKFAVGYQLAEAGEPSFVEVVAEFADSVAEVYFPWVAMPSGRPPIGLGDPSAAERLEADLRALREMGVRLDLLLNANCYGPDAAGRKLQRAVTDLLDRLAEKVGGVETVTTASPAVAHVVKTHAPNVEVRASVNMRIGTPAAMEYVADLFDAYTVRRECNRDLAHLTRLKRWADARGKRLVMLANSGCLADCPGQTFHDNLVAHQADAAAGDGFIPHVCWKILRDRAAWPAILQATWVRPEDLHHYDGLFDVVKLATRLHDRPWIVLRAYAQRRWRGNLLDLLEPTFSAALAPHAIDNARFPADWFDRSGPCGRRCESCDYCRRVLDEVLVRIDGDGAAGP